MSFFWSSSKLLPASLWSATIVVVNSQMAKDKLRNHDAFLLVSLDGYTAPIVVNRNLVLFAINVDFDRVHGRVVDLPLAWLTCTLTLLSAELTRISSKILKKPGT